MGQQWSTRRARRHDHHRHVRGGPFRRGRRPRGPRLLRHRQPAACAHPQGRRAGARPRGRQRASASSSTPARGSSPPTSTNALTELRGIGRRDPGAVPRRGRRGARAPVRGHASAPPARRERPRHRRHRPRARAARGAQGRGRRRDRHVGAQRPRAPRPPARALRRVPEPRRRPADQHRVVRVQARAPARRRPRLRLPLPARTRTGSTSSAPSPAPTRPSASTCSRRTTPGRSSSSSSSCFALLLPAYVREGKSYLSLGLGCTGGRHRSVVIAEELGAVLERLGYLATIHHRDIERDCSRGAGPTVRRSSPSAAATASRSRSPRRAGTRARSPRS